MLHYKSKLKIPQFFVSIGAGTNQVPLITAAKRLGFNVIGVDRNPCAEGAGLCDLKIQESIDNYEEIYQKILAIILFGDIKGVLSRSYGSAVKSACFIANKLNIPLMPYERMDDFISKNRMKSVFETNGLNTPLYIQTDQNNFRKAVSKLSYPCVVKPVTGHAKTGVQRIESKADMQHFLAGNDRKKCPFIIEEFVRGDEIIAVGMIYQHRYNLIGITDKKLTPPPYFVDLEHIYPSRYFDLWDRISAIGQRVADAFDIATSPLIMELIVSEGRELSLIEAAPEFGGEFISDVLIPEGTGYNLIQQSIRAVSGLGFRTPVQKRIKASIAVRYITARPGTLASWNEKAARRLPGILHVKLFKKAGSATAFPTTNHDRIGVIIARGKTREAAQAAAARAESALNITLNESESGHNEQ